MDEPVAGSVPRLVRAALGLRSLTAMLGLLILICTSLQIFMWVVLRGADVDGSTVSFIGGGVAGAAACLVLSWWLNRIHHRTAVGAARDPGTARVDEKPS